MWGEGGREPCACWRELARPRPGHPMGAFFLRVTVCFFVFSPVFFFRIVFLPSSPPPPPPHTIVRGSRSFDPYRATLATLPFKGSKGTVGMYQTPWRGRKRHDDGDRRTKPTGHKRAYLIVMDTVQIRFLSD